MAGIVPGTELTYFLSVDFVEGSATDASHPGALVVSSYDISVTQPASALGGSSEAPAFGALTVTLADDAGLAEMLKLLAFGKHVSRVTLTGRVTGSTPYDAYRLDLDEVFVTRVEDKPGGGYELALDYRVVEFATNGRTASGTTIPLSFGWDRATNSQATAVGDGAESIVGATAPTRYFLLINGADGASTDAAHQGWFEVADFSLAATAASSGGGGTGAAAFGPLTVEFDSDAGLTSLLNSAATGRHLTGVRLQGVTSGPSPATVYDLTLYEVVVLDIFDGSRAGYSLSLEYRNIELVTRDPAGATTGVFGYDTVLPSEEFPNYPLAPGSAPGNGTPGSETFTYYLALDGIAGNSTDASHPGALVLTYYQFGAERPPTHGGGIGSATFSPLTVGVADDAALASVMSLLARGQHVSAATLTARTAGTQPYDVYALDLGDVTVSRVYQNASGDYQLQLDYRQIELITRAPTATGAVVTEGVFGWDPERGSVGVPGDGAEAIAPAPAPSKFFLLVDGIDGGSTDARHVGWFEINGFLFNSAPFAAGTPPDFETMIVSLSQLGGFTALLQGAATGTHLRGVRIEGMSAGATPTAVYDLTLSDVIVRHVDDFRDGRSVEFDYSRVELITRGQNTAGAFVQTGAFGFDRATKTVFTPTSLPSLVPGDAPGDGTPAPGFALLPLIVSGVSGTSTDLAHPGALLASGYNFEVTQSATAVGADAAGVSTFDPLSVTIQDDTGLARMLSLMATGQHVPGATLTVPAASGQAFDLLKLDLGDVSVIAVEDSPVGGYEATLAYRQIDVTTYARPAQSAVITTGSFGWDTATRTVADAPGDSTEPATVATHADRYFLVVDGIEGGATDASHTGWFEVIHHTLATSKAAAGTGSGAGAPTFGTLGVAFFKEDTGLVDLLQRAVTGMHLKGVRLEGVTTAATPLAVYDLTLSNVVVREVADHSNYGYTVEFDYSRIELITRGPASGGGTVQTGAFGFDVASGTAFTPTGLPPLSPFSVAAHDDSYVVLQGQTMSIAATLGVLANDDVSAGATVSLRTAPLHGTLQLAANGGFSYTPAAGSSGIDSFAYRVASGAGSTSDGVVTVQVVPVVSGDATTTLGLVSLSAEQQIASTYIAFFGRAADAGGFDFWVGEFNRGLPVQGPAALFANIASSFGISSEARALYPFLANPFGAGDAQISAFLGTVYDNLFNRSPDAGGLAYWTGQVRATLAAGQFVGSVLVNIMSGAQDTAAGPDITTLMGKVAVSLAYVQEQVEHGTVWAGASDVAAATSLLHGVTSDPSSVLIGIRNAEFLISNHA